VDEEILLDPLLIPIDHLQQQLALRAKSLIEAGLGDAEQPLQIPGGHPPVAPRPELVESAVEHLVDVEGSGTAPRGCCRHCSSG
jgi:hypothetical protein